MQVNQSQEDRLNLYYILNLFFRKPIASGATHSEHTSFMGTLELSAVAPHIKNPRKLVCFCTCIKLQEVVLNACRYFRAGPSRSRHLD